LARADVEHGNKASVRIVNSTLWSLTALELADVIASGEARAIDVVQAHFDRIALVNPAVNAITNVLVQTALEAAREVDLRRAKGEILGPFAGVPFNY